MSVNKADNKKGVKEFIKWYKKMKEWYDPEGYYPNDCTHNGYFSKMCTIDNLGVNVILEKMLMVKNNNWTQPANDSVNTHWYNTFAIPKNVRLYLSHLKNAIKCKYYIVAIRYKLALKFSLYTAIT